MSRKIGLIPHDTDMPIEKWHKKIRDIKDNEVKLKMLVIEKIMSNPNISVKDVKSIFFISTTRMNEWINQYNNNGLEGLKAKKEEGRGSGKGNKKYDDEVYVSLKEEMDKSDKKWTLKEMQFYLNEKFGIKPTFPTISKRIKNI